MEKKIEIKSIYKHKLIYILIIKMEYYKLLIKPCNVELVTTYENHASFHQGDSGYDLFVPEDVLFATYGETRFVDLGIQCEMLNQHGFNVSYYLYPRSSISKTPLMLHNNVGIIDAGYRGNMIAALKFLPSDDDKFKYNKDTPYVLKKGTRVVQICSPTLEPIVHEICRTLSETTRGSGGFGSTGQ
jgi:dUTP pyrophosphatase